MQQFFFELIQIALGNREMLTSIPSAEEWEEAYELARKQAIAGIAFMGVLSYVEKQHKKCRMQDAGCRNVEHRTWNLEPESSDDEEEFDESWLEAVNLPEELYYTWMRQAMDGENNYKVYVEIVNELADTFINAGMKMMVMKGYGLSLLYPIPAHRPTGDIDIYLGDDYDKSNELVEAMGIDIDFSHHKHSVFRFKGKTVENHHSFLNTYGHASTAKIEKILLGTMDKRIDCGNMYLPSPHFNVLYLLRHMAEHFASTDIQLRHVLDWGLFVSRYTKDIDWDWFLNTVKELKMDRFLACIIGICTDDLNMDKSAFPIVTIDKELKQRVLGDILQPEFQEEAPKGFIKGIAFKFRRWRANAWKHNIVFREPLLCSFITQSWSHILKPSSMRN